MVSKLLLGLLIFCGMPVVAQAGACTIPYTFIQGTVANAAQMMANYLALQSCTNSISSIQVGPPGFFASNFKATTTIQGTFGGTQQYTFPAGLTVTNALSTTGNITSTGAGQSPYVLVAGGNVPQNYLASGTQVNTGFHGVFGQITGFTNIACGPFGTTFCVIVTLSGSAVFTSGGTTGAVPSFTCGDSWSINAANTYFISNGGLGAIAMQVGLPNTLYVNGSTLLDATTINCWGF